MGKFVPFDFELTPELKKWAKNEGISDRDVRFQTEIFLDHEFKRSYTKWDRVWKNWMRKAIQIGQIQLEGTLEAKAKELGLERGKNETDESLKRRIGIEETKRLYSR